MYPATRSRSVTDRVPPHGADEASPPVEEQGRRCDRRKVDDADEREEADEVDCHRDGHDDEL